MKNLVIALALIVAIVALVTQLYFAIFVLPLSENNTLSKKLTEVNGWKLKKSVLGSSSDKCDILRIDYGGINAKVLGDLLRSNIPFVIQNAVNDWPARSKWEREHLLGAYSHRTVTADSEATIVQGGGHASPSTTFGVLLEQIRNCSIREFSSGCSDDFVFDTSILSNIPELDKDIKVLPIFKEWDNAGTRQTRAAWHMLSLGPINTGLPFHSHGKTWISIINGAKSWYLYPPGFDIPSSSIAQYSSLESVLEVQDRILTKLVSLPSPLTFYQNNLTWVQNLKFSQEYKPLYCLQKAGDIMYLPDLWSHLTVNEGETVAYGGQSALSPEHRFSLSRKILDSHPSDFEMLKNAGLGLGHMTISMNDNIQRSVQYLGSLLRVVDVYDLQKLVDMTEDVWVRIQIDRQSNSDNDNNQVSIESFREMLHNIADAGKGQWNLVILNEDIEFMAHLGRLKEKLSLDRIRVTMDSKPILKNTVVYQPLHRDDVLSLSQDIESWIAATIHVYYLESGSILTGNSRKVSRMFAETKGYLRKAIHLRPYRVESWRLLAEITGSLGHVEEGREIVQEAVNFFRSVIDFEFSSMSVPSKISITRRAAASIFHQLGTTLLSFNSPQEAVLLFIEALKIDPTHSASVVDRIVAAVMSGELREARKQFHYFQSKYPNHFEIRRLRSMIDTASRFPQHNP